MDNKTELVDHTKVKEYLVGKEIPVVEVASTLGVTRQHAYNLLNGITPMTIDKLEILAIRYHMEIIDYISDQYKHHFID